MTFFLLGSGEFEAWTHEPEARLMASASGDGTVVILPTASATEGDAVFERWSRMGLEHFAESGIPAEILPVRRREDAFREDLATRVEAASMVYFSGGKPSYLASVPRRDAAVRGDRTCIGARSGLHGVQCRRDGGEPGAC